MLTIQQNGDIREVDGRIEAIIRKLLQAEQLILAQKKPVKYVVHCGALPEDVEIEIPVTV